MHRTFLGLAAIVAAMLLAAVVVGFVADGEASWIVAHERLGLTGLAAAVAVQQLGLASLRDGSRRVEALVRERDLPDWVASVAARNWRRVVPFGHGGLGLVVASIAAGWAVGLRALAPAWHLGVAAAALAFLPGALLAEALSIGAQARLVEEIEGRVEPSSEPGERG